ncbi:MAG: RNA pyrophosphohydrolase [Pseudomonadota bacterium]
MNNSSEEALYRPCVGIALFNQEGKVFLGERIDTPGAWQMPQGGIDPDEDLEIAAFRELKEETGIENASIIKINDQKIRYETPPGLREKLQEIWGAPYIGQEQTWIAMRFHGQDKDINLESFEHPEFSAWQWCALEKTLDHIVPFKRDVYTQLIEAFKDIAQNN